MATLLVRNADGHLVQNLHGHAAVPYRRPEAEHRKILANAPWKPWRGSFPEVRMSMPDAGDDADFERV